MPAAVYFPDLATECQIARGENVRAIGWLGEGHAVPRGKTDPRVVDALVRLRDEGWVHVAAAGPHLCELCHAAREARNILVPGRGVLYVAPAMILHYVSDHAYGAPTEFCDAVLACPIPPSNAYFDALRPFLAVFGPPGRPMTTAEFDRDIELHREHVEERVAAREAAARRKGFTWD